MLCLRNTSSKVLVKEAQCERYLTTYLLRARVVGVEGTAAPVGHPLVLPRFTYTSSRAASISCDPHMYAPLAPSVGGAPRRGTAMLWDTPSAVARQLHHSLAHWTLQPGSTATVVAW